jgi:hypothetical protein
MAAQLAFFDGLTERNAILQRFQENHRVYLEAVRSFARVIAMRTGCVSIDDVRDELARREFPMPLEIGVTERVFGPLFLTKDFVPWKRVPTRRTDWAKRVGRARSDITVYRLAGME